MGYSDKESYLEDKLDELKMFGKKALVTGGIVAGISASIFGAVKGLDAIIPDVVSEEQQEVMVKIDDVYHRPGYTTAVKTSKSYTTIYHPSIWRTYVEYEGERYTISGSITYKQYKDKIGDEVIGNMNVKTYENGEVKYFLDSLELPETIYRLETNDGSKDYTIINIADSRWSTTYYTNDDLEITIDKDNGRCSIYDASSFFKEKIATYENNFSFEDISNLEKENDNIEL